MFNTNRDPFETLREQWGTAQELAVGSFQKAQEREDIKTGIEREEARYEQQRTDALSAEARRVALEQLRQLDEALAQMDPDDPEDAEAYQQGLLARNHLTSVLGQEGQGALSAIAEGRVQSDGRLVPVGEAVAAAGARGRAAGDRRAIEAEERAFAREQQKAVMGFEFQAGEAEKQREFEAMMQEAEHLLRQGLTTQQIAAQLHEQAVSLGFQKDQGALDRALQREIEQGRIALETRRLNVTDSAALAAQYTAQIASLDPSREVDRAALSAILQGAQVSGMTPEWIAVVTAQAEAQVGSGARLGFARTEAELADLRAATAARKAGIELTEAQVGLLAAQESYTRRQITSMDVADAETRARTNAANYDLQRAKVMDGRADIIEFQDFIVNTTALGSLGLPALQQMLFDIENGIEDSIYAPYMGFVTPEMLEAAIEKATEIDADGDLSRSAWIQQTRGAIIDGNLENIERAAAYLNPEDIDALLNAADDDPMFEGDMGQTMRWLRASLEGNPGLVAAAERKAGLRRMGENQPQIASATARLDFYASQRPDNIEMGAEGVRGALRVLADNGLFGDPLNPEATNDLIEQHVSFYRRAWGDQEGEFNAEMAESASRTALNQANAALAWRNVNGPTGGGPIGADLDTLKFIRDTTDRQIAATKLRMEAAGCVIADMVNYQAAAMQRGPQGTCEALSLEVRAYEEQYNDALSLSGYPNPKEREARYILEGIASGVDADMPDATPEEKEAEVLRRYREVTSPMGADEPEEPEAREPAGPPPTARERGEAVAGAAAGALRGVEGALSGAARGFGDFMTGLVGGGAQQPAQPAPGPSPQVSFGDNAGLQQLAGMPYSYGGRQMTVGEAWQMAVSDPTMRMGILEHVMSQSGIDRETATAALNQLITGR